MSRREIQSGIHVSIRSRPLNTEEMERDEELIVHPGLASGSCSLESNPRNTNYDSLAAKHVTAKNYQVDSYFGPEDDTEYIYNYTAANLIPNLVDGFNCSVFCYGPTGTGKTYTMFGSEESPGIVRHALRDLFKEMFEVSRPGYIDKQIILSVVEVYGEDVRDLLDERRDPSRGPSARRHVGIGLINKGIKIYNVDQALELIERARSSRVTHSTNANAESSRSHCIIQLKVRMTQQWGDIRESKMNLIDLAGSERVHQTGLTGGDRMKEACNINSSLLALKKCISGLAKGKEFIPYRDSKLTQILQDCLGGNCLTYLIACVSPGSSQWQSTRDTLDYATTARSIKLTARQQFQPSMSLKAQVRFLKHQNQTLITRVREFEKESMLGEIAKKKIEREFRMKELEMEHEIERMRREHLKWIEEQERILKRKEQEQMRRMKAKEQRILADAMANAGLVIDIDEEQQKILDYKEELRAKAEGSQCVICIDRVASHAFLPCGHRCICKKCSTDMKQKNLWGAGKKCPLCKRAAKSIKQIFL